jgi:hypothetical protein
MLSTETAQVIQENGRSHQANVAGITELPNGMNRPVEVEVAVAGSQSQSRSTSRVEVEVVVAVEWKRY